MKVGIEEATKNVYNRMPQIQWACRDGNYLCLPLSERWKSEAQVMHSQLISVYPFYSVTSFLRFFALRRLNLPEEFGVEKHLILFLPEDHGGFRNTYIFGCANSKWKFPGQGPKLCHSSHPNHGSDNAKSLTCCATKELWEIKFLCVPHMF